MVAATRQTALTWAAFKGHVDVVRFLLQNGADATLKDKDGVGPRDAVMMAVKKNLPRSKRNMTAIVAELDHWEVRNYTGAVPD